MKKELVELLKNSILESKPRKFPQAVDVCVNFKNINFKLPQNRVDVTVEFPKPFTKETKVLLFASESGLQHELKDLVDRVVAIEDIPNLDKKAIKGIAMGYDLFFAETKAMPIVGKYLGQALAPRGKMPKLALPNKNAMSAMIQKEQNSVKITNKKGKFLPTVHFKIGTEKMQAEDLALNLSTAMEKLLASLPSKEQNIRSMYVKTTMGKALPMEMKLFL